MAGQTSARTVNAMKYVIYDDMLPIDAARRAQIALSTMYRCSIYKLWKGGDIEGAKQELARLDGSLTVPQCVIQASKRKKSAKQKSSVDL